MRRKAALSRSLSALLLTSLLVLPAAASADGGGMLTSGGKSTADSPAFGSGAGVAAEDSGGYLGSGHASGKSADSGYFGSGHKDGGTIVTSGGVRAWTVTLLRTWLRLPLSPRHQM
ncbi:MAG TPA: hypothetical protein VIW92_04185 [Thermoanaerobaculia bacterium]